MIYRNKKLINLAKEAPYCMSCMRTSDGTIVASHSNSSAHGKGMGIKASDAMICYICFKCHSEIDSGKKSREEKIYKWEQAFIRTMRWLFESGNVTI